MLRQQFCADRFEARGDFRRGLRKDLKAGPNSCEHRKSFKLRNGNGCDSEQRFLRPNRN